MRIPWLLHILTSTIVTVMSSSDEFVIPDTYQKKKIDKEKQSSDQDKDDDKNKYVRIRKETERLIEDAWKERIKAKEELARKKKEEQDERDRLAREELVEKERIAREKAELARKQKKKQKKTG